MQKLFLFEISTALKDRPRYFRVITLILFALSLTMVLVCCFARLSSLQGNQVYQPDGNAQPISGFQRTGATSMLLAEK